MKKEADGAVSQQHLPLTADKGWSAGSSDIETLYPFVSTVGTVVHGLLEYGRVSMKRVHIL